ncbi:MAG: hypothetical protein JO038_02235 [Alphaproteobacteria bacterium]|nr:hypothetical protein [Alphaproteobacteria bacterium]
MQLADLAAWTPVAVNLGSAAPSVDWGDLRGVRFAEPFLQQTVGRWAGDDPQPLIRTSLDVLAALDVAPSLDPAGLVFHLSRCGSTLLSRLLSVVPGTLVVSEPPPLNTLVAADPGAIDDAALVPMLRAMVRALGRIRFGDERRYILKLSSWNVRRIGLFRRAFPEVPVVWVQRDPIEVVASLLADEPGWAKLQRFPAELERLFGLAEQDIATSDEAGFYAQALAALLRAVAEDKRGTRLVLDYRELPNAIWERAAPFLGIGLDPADIARMRDEARYDSKSVGQRPFAARVAAGAALGDCARAVIEQLVTPLYRAVAQ